MLRVGIIGTIVSVFCCFTPFLTTALMSAGLVAWTSYLDLVLLPAIAFFLGLTVYALWKRTQT